ncbi:MAG: MATE family efflux transporter [Saprospiraceae bacterium]|nr:MATE family efflux transporter [Saprospiraceae bacterium]
MLGSAAQNLVTLTDSIFLYHLSEIDFAAIGFVSLFYLTIAAIGYGFSKGGQILIARRMGEKNFNEVGRTFYDMLYFELALALVMFLLITYGCPTLFKWIVESPLIYEKSLIYLKYRSWGVFFSYAGVAFIALYTGMARTKFIMIDTVILAVVNFVLNYGLVFGNFGLPKMGIGGTALASTIAEGVALLTFIIYTIFDKKAKALKLFKLHPLDIKLIKQQLNIATPAVAQSVVGLGSWFLFVSLIESLGERVLAINNVVRIVYLTLSIPCWGFSSAINTIVSNFIGQSKRMAVMPMIWKTAILSLTITLALAIPVTLYPEYLLYPLFGGADMSLVLDAHPIFKVLLAILAVFSISSVYFNGLAGTGATFIGLKIQFLCALIYILYIYIIVFHTNGGLPWAWSAEIVYWVCIFALTYWYLDTKKWHFLKF